MKKFEDVSSTKSNIFNTLVATSFSLPEMSEGGPHTVPEPHKPTSALLQGLEIKQETGLVR